MKKILLVLPVIGLVFAGCGKKDTTTTTNQPTVADKAEMAARNTSDRTREMANDVRDGVSGKLTEWKLTTSDIKADLEKGTRVVRSKANATGAKAGAMFDNAKVVTVINGKLVADSQLSALKINVDADKGVVTLKGSVKSPELIGRAMVLALDTEDVWQVVSLLTVAP